MNKRDFIEDIIARILTAWDKPHPTDLLIYINHVDKDSRKKPPTVNVIERIS
ncbi:unnamed protein product [marine sediment metagenome]|uniref:Uncharacterized protein n=1 Tax=marine sediment metagenome TaxID=412755 RepID=X1CXL4_9ZZZZ